MNKTKKSKKRRMNIFSSVIEGWKMFENLPPESLASLRNFLMFALVADLLLVIGYIRMDRLGIFLFIIILIFLVLVLMNERRQNDKMMEDIGIGNDDETEDKESSEDDIKETEKKSKSPIDKINEQDLLGLGDLEKDIQKVREDIGKSVNEGFTTSYV